MQICEKHGLPYKTITREFEDEAAAKEWILRNQLGRRNLPLYEKGRLVLQLEEIVEAIKGRAKEREREGGRSKGSMNSSNPIHTRTELAGLAGVSEQTIDRVKMIEEKGTEEQKQALRCGRTTINREYVRLSKQQKQAEREAGRIL